MEEGAASETLPCEGAPLAPAGRPSDGTHLATAPPPREGTPLDQEDSLLGTPGAPGPATVAKRRFGRPAAAAASLLLVAATATYLAQRTGGLAVAGSPGQATALWAAESCTQYFNWGGNCAKPPHWQCSNNDGSLAWRCCCGQGWGEFGQSADWMTGEVRWNRPDLEELNQLCLATPNPYAGPGFATGDLVMAPCAFGSPSKQFHMPRNESGQFRWATHNELCVAVQNGYSLTLRPCRQTAPQLTELRQEGGRLVWAAHPDRCVEVGAGNRVSLGACVENSTSQAFELREPPPLPRPDETPSLFCVSLMMPFGSEVSLIRMQFQNGIGIFACEMQAVYSNVTMSFYQGNRSLVTGVMPGGSLQVGFGGQWHYALNTEVFIRFWGQVSKDPRADKAEWTVKLDPDCVFFPGRLQQMLRMAFWDGKTDKKVVWSNCHLGNHGPIEVLSRKVLQEYRKRWWECKNQIFARKYTGFMQEDVYFAICWHDYLHAEERKAYNLLFEEANACHEKSNTRDGRHPCFSKQVSFHPFKSPASYLACHKKGSSMSWAAPFRPLQQAPGPFNHYHA